MRRSDLVPDCGSCDAVCCVATSFEASDDFAIDKPAGVACPNLAGQHCSIHAELAVRGFSGCTVFDCHGAGPRVTRLLPRGLERDEAFRILCQVHELLWLLAEAAKLCPSEQLDHEIAALEAIARAPAAELFALDLQPHATAARAVLRAVGERIGGRARLVQLRRC
jgi:hypothetical protein